MSEKLPKSMICTYCGDRVSEPELDEAVWVMFPSICTHCKNKNYSDAYSFMVCAKCHFLTSGFEDDYMNDSKLLAWGLIRPGETRASKVRELKKSFEKRAGKKLRRWLGLTYCPKENNEERSARIIKGEL